MKKLFFVLCSVSLIFALCSTFVFATSENTPDVVTGEIDNLTEVGESETADTDTAETFYSGWIDKITDSTLWINIGTVALACIAIIGTVASKFKSILDLISKKADSNTVINTVKDSVEEIRASFKEELRNIKEEISVTESNEETLLAILTIFITNAKINANAKAEIMNYITGIKRLEGSVEEIVKKANETIATANEAEEKTPTPALDELAAAQHTYMELG